MAYTPSKDIITSSSPYTPTTTLTPHYLQNLVGDPYYDNVSLLLHMDGTNGSTTFTDSSSNEYAVTKLGNTVISNANSRFGESALFDGVGDYLRLTDSASARFGTGDFTVEASIYVDTIPTTVDNEITILGFTPWVSNLMTFRIRRDSGNPTVWNESVLAQSSIPIIAGQWNHVAYTRESGTLRIFVNGILGATVANYTTNLTTTNAMVIGGNAYGDNQWYLDGYMDEFRITKGIARYTEDFTVSIEAFPDYELQPASPIDPYYDNVVLLLHMDGDEGAAVFTDSSILNNTVTPTGATTTSSVAKFGQSADVTGAGAKLSVPILNVLDFLDEDFTIELQVNLVSAAGYNTFLTTRSGSGANGIQILSSDGGMAVWLWDISQTYLLSTISTHASTTLQDNTTYHIAVQRSGNILTQYIDGIKQTVSNITGTPYTPSSTVAIGTHTVSGNYPTQDMSGYVDEVRITRGIARYSDGFSTQIAPFSDIRSTGDKYYENVSLLLHGDNANGSTTIIDSSSRNLSLPTAPSIYNNNTKYIVNESSISLNDEDMIIPAGTFDFGLDDFTIEFWINAESATSPYPAILSSDIDTGNSAGFVAYISGAGTSWGGNDTFIFKATSGGGYPFVMTSTTQNFRSGTWNHVAIVREGKGHRLYVNGILEDSDPGIDINNYAEGNTNKLNGQGAYVNYSDTGYIDELRVTKGVARYSDNFQPETSAYSNFVGAEGFTKPVEAMLGRVSLLMHGDGTDGSLVFTDSSRHDAAATLYGNASISTAIAAIGSSSLYFDGVDSRIEYPDSDAYAFGTDDFTIEFWMYALSNDNSGFIVCQADNESAQNVQWLIFLDSATSQVGLRTGTSGGTWDNAVSSSSSVRINEWAHVAVVAHEGNLAVYVNGIADSALIGYVALGDSAWPLSIGGSSTGLAGKFFDGYIDELRITKGQAIYTGNFEVEYSRHKGREDRIAAPRGDISKVSLMLNVDETSGSTTVDSSLYENVITTTGNPVIGNVSVNTGSVSSMYFDGTSDYLTAPASVSNFGTEDFTIEFWVNIDLTGPDPWPRIFSTSVWNTGTGLYSTIDGATTLWGGDGRISFNRASDSTGFSVRSRAIVRGTGWHHIAITRRGLESFLFIDGYLEDHRKTPAIWNISSDFTRFFAESGEEESGYLDGVKITKGEAAHAEDFIPDYNFSLDLVDYNYDNLFPYNKTVREPSSYNLEQRLTFSSGNITIRMSGDGNTIVAAYPGASPTYQGRAYYATRTSGVWSGWTEIALADPRSYGHAGPRYVNEDGSRILMNSDYGTGTSGGLVEVYDWNGSDYIRTDYFFDSTAERYNSSDIYASDSGNILSLSSHTYGSSVGVFSIYNLIGGSYARDVNTPTAVSDPLGTASNVNFYTYYPVSINELLTYSVKISRSVITSISDGVVTYKGLIPIDHSERIRGFSFTKDGSDYPTSVQTIDKNGILSSSAFTVSGTTAVSPLVSSDGRTVAVVNYNYTHELTLHDQYIDVYVASDHIFSFTYDDDGLIDADYVFTFRHNDEATPEDIHISDVALLLHMDGTVGSTTFVDSSQYAHPVTANADVNIAAIGKFAQSACFDGAGDYLSVAYSAPLDFSVNEFTLEFWYYRTGDHEQFARVFTTAGNDGYPGMYIVSTGLTSSGDLVASFSSTGASFDIGNITLSNSIGIGAWTHIAVCKSSTEIVAYIDGVAVGSILTAANLYNSIQPIQIGGQSGTSRSINGYIDELRFTRNVVRYTEDFAPSIIPFPAEIVRIDDDFSNVSLLMHMDDVPGTTVFTDSSVYNHISTEYGNAHISADTGRFGHSAIFDGVSDYIEMSSGQEFDMGDDPYTIELSFSILGNSLPDFNAERNASLLGTWTNDLADGWAVILTGSTSVTGVGIAIDYWDNGSNRTRHVYTPGSPLLKDVTYNLAIVRSSIAGSPKMYLDGQEVVVTRELIGIDPGNVLNTNGHNLKIGGTAYASYPFLFNGHIDEIRISKGIARYLTSYTPSAQVFPSEGNPAPGDPFWDSVVFASHLNGELGAATVKDESPGNITAPLADGISQSASQSKFGGSSLEVLVSGYMTLSLPGSSVRTIEMFFKRSAVGTTNGFFNSGGNNICPYIRSSNEFAIWFNGSRYTSTTFITDTDWHHIAMVFGASETRVYIDGILALTVGSPYSWGGSMYMANCRGAYGVAHFNGWLDEIVVTNAEKYTEDFIIATEEFPNFVPVITDAFYEDVILLMHMDGTDGESVFIDSSSHEHAMTATGTITTEGDRLRTLSTGYIYGPGGSLFALGTEDFTYEISVEISDLTTNSYILTFEPDGGVNSIVADLLFDASDNTFRYYESGYRILSSPILADTIYQLAITRTFKTVRMFLDGVLQGTYYSSADLIAGTDSPKIGRLAYTNTNRFRGYLDDLRITKNVSRYTEDYTVATDPFPSVGEVAPIVPTVEIAHDFSLPYDDEETTEYAHTFSLQYTMGLYGIPFITIADISLSTLVENQSHLFRFVYDTELRQEADYVYELPYGISHIDDIHEFRLTYEFNKELVDTSYEFRIPYRFSLGTTLQKDYSFNLRYTDTGYLQQEWAHTFGLPYSIGLSNYVNNLFTIRYTNTALFLSDEYVFNLRSDFGLIRHRDYEFKARYVDASFVASAEYVYHFRSLLGAVEERETDFNFRYRYDYYTPVSYEFNMSYHIRLANAANPDNVTTTITPNGNGGADFELQIIDVEMMQGDYVLAIDSGSSYSSFFVKYTVPDTGASIVDMTLYDSNGVTIDVSFTDVLDIIKFTIRDIDIDSSISISSYGIDNNEFTVMFNEWPNWSSYVHEDLEEFSSLIQLDSGNFKILPLQPNTCCILQTSELCILPPYSDVDNIALAVESLSLDWIEINTAIWNTSGMAKNCSVGLTEAALAPDRTVSMLSAEIIGPGVLTFDWMLEATGSDSMWFEVEDLFSEHIQGTQEWETKTIDIPRGRYMIEWFYIKDELNSSPTDISAIDKITYTHS